MDEIYKWIESNCHALKYEFDVENNDNCIVKVINPVLNEVQREMLSKLFSDDVDVISYANVKMVLRLVIFGIWLI